MHLAAAVCLVLILTVPDILKPLALFILLLLPNEIPLLDLSLELILVLFLFALFLLPSVVEVVLSRQRRAADDGVLVLVSILIILINRLTRVHYRLYRLLRILIHVVFALTIHVLAKSSFVLFFKGLCRTILTRRLGE